MDLVHIQVCLESLESLAQPQHMKVIYEFIKGENTILYLQVARFILKSLGFIAKGKALPPTVEYLR